MTFLEPTIVERDLVANLDLARRVVDAMNDHAEVSSVDVSGSRVSVHLIDPCKAENIAAMYALADSRNYGGPSPFATHEGEIDGLSFTVFGAPISMARAV